MFAFSISLSISYQNHYPSAPERPWLLSLNVPIKINTKLFMSAPGCFSCLIKSLLNSSRTCFWAPPHVPYSRITEFEPLLNKDHDSIYSARQANNINFDLILFVPVFSISELWRLWILCFWSQLGTVIFCTYQGDGNESYSSPELFAPSRKSQSKSFEPKF